MLKFLVEEYGMFMCHTDPCILFLHIDRVLEIIMLIHANDSLCTDSKEDLEALYVNIHSRY